MEGINCLQLLIDGQRDGLACLYNLFSKDLYRYGMSICKNEEEVLECLQDFFVYLWEARIKLGGVENPKAYLMISYKRRLVKQLQKQNKVSEYDIKYENQFSESSVEDKWVDAEINEEYLQRLSSAVQKLSTREREVVQLKYFEKYNNEEIAELLEINNQSVRNLLYRAIQNLRKII